MIWYRYDLRYYVIWYNTIYEYMRLVVLGHSMILRCYKKSILLRADKYETGMGVASVDGEIEEKKRKNISNENWTNWNPSPQRQIQTGMGVKKSATENNGPFTWKNVTLISVTGGAIVWRVSFPRQKMWFKESDPIYITFSNCTKVAYFLGWPVWKTWKLFRKSFISRTQIARNWSEMNKCKALVSRICATPWIGNTRWIKRNHWWRFILLPEI